MAASPERRFARLERRLAYVFQSESLLVQALTHRSVGTHNNERLEFLGDAALGYVVAEALYQAFPESSEADLTLMRASLVKKSSLGALARELDIGEFLTLGIGERKAGGRDRTSILADALEALLGAVVIESGPVEARRVINGLFAERIDKLDGHSEKDPKTALQELLQKSGFELPRYTVLETEGEAHARRYTVSCEVAVLDIRSQGSASSRRDAEKSAAQAMLDRLHERLSA